MQHCFIRFMHKSFSNGKRSIDTSNIFSMMVYCSRVLNIRNNTREGHDAKN